MTVSERYVQFLSTLFSRDAAFPHRNRSSQSCVVCCVYCFCPLACFLSCQFNEHILKQPNNKIGSGKLDSLCRDLDPLANDLVRKLVCLDPRQRISAAEVCAHPFFNLIRNTDHDPAVDAFESKRLQTVTQIDPSVTGEKTRRGFFRAMLQLQQRDDWKQHP